MSGKMDGPGVLSAGGLPPPVVPPGVSLGDAAAPSNTLSGDIAPGETVATGSEGCAELCSTVRCTARLWQTPHPDSYTRRRRRGCRTTRGRPSTTMRYARGTS